MKVEKDYVVLEDVVRNSYASVVWSHKIQEKQADIYTERYGRFEFINIFAASLTSAGIISSIITDQMCLKIITAIISFITVFIAAYYKSFDLQKMTAQHQHSAVKLIEVRDKYRILLLKIKLHSDSVTQLIAEYEELVNSTNRIYAEAPRNSNKAVERARYALNIAKRQ